MMHCSHTTFTRALLLSIGLLFCVNCQSDTQEGSNHDSPDSGHIHTTDTERLDTSPTTDTDPITDTERLDTSPSDTNNNGGFDTNSLDDTQNDTDITQDTTDQDTNDVPPDPQTPCSNDDQCPDNFFCAENTCQSIFLSTTEAPINKADERFGESLAIHNNTLAVSAPSNERCFNDVLDISDEPLTDEQTAILTNGRCFHWTGAVYIFEYENNIAKKQWFIKPPTKNVLSFGKAIALDDKQLVVANSSHKYVHVYEKSDNEWTLKQTLSIDVDMQYNSNPSSMILQDDTLIIGAGRANNCGSVSYNKCANSGRVSIYSRDADGTWSRDQILIPANNQKGFGESISLDGDRLAVGGPWIKNVAIFSKNNGTWTLDTTIPPEVDDSFFGHAVALKGTTLAISATLVEQRGAVFLYHLDNNNWTLHTTLKEQQLPKNIDLGDNLHLINENQLVVGAPLISSCEPGISTTITPDMFSTDDACTKTGAILLYRRNASNDWNRELFIRNPLARIYGRFGYAYTQIHSDQNALYIGNPRSSHCSELDAYGSCADRDMGFIHRFHGTYFSN